MQKRILVRTWTLAGLNWHLSEKSHLRRCRGAVVASKTISICCGAQGASLPGPGRGTSHFRCGVDGRSLFSLTVALFGIALNCGPAAAQDEPKPPATYSALPTE